MTEVETDLQISVDLCVDCHVRLVKCNVQGVNGGG